MCTDSVVNIVKVQALMVTEHLQKRNHLWYYVDVNARLSALPGFVFH